MNGVAVHPVLQILKLWTLKRFIKIHENIYKSNINMKHFFKKKTGPLYMTEPKALKTY